MSTTPETESLHMNTMNLKKFVKKLPRYAKLFYNPEDGEVVLKIGASEKKAETVWSKHPGKNIAFKLGTYAPGFMFRVLSGKLYIREEIV